MNEQTQTHHGLPDICGAEKAVIEAVALMAKLGIKVVEVASEKRHVLEPKQ